MHEAIVAAVDEARSRPSEQLMAACTAYVDFALHNRGLYRTMYAAELAERPNDVRAKVREGSAHFSDLAQLKARVFSLFVDRTGGADAGRFSEGSSG